MKMLKSRHERDLSSQTTSLDSMAKPLVGVIGGSGLCELLLLVSALDGTLSMLARGRQTWPERGEGDQHRPRSERLAFWSYELQVLTSIVAQKGLC